MRKLYGVQYLRALAAIGVVVFHAAEKTGQHFTIGAAGVDIFFVISGFIMWVMAAERPTTPGTFLLGRFLRIAPLYWIVTGIMVFGALLGLFPNLVLSAEHVFASLGFIPARSPSSGEIWPVLVQGWTLNYEMFFYCIFAMALAVPQRARLLFITCIFFVLCFAGILYGGTNPLALTYTDPLLLEFLLGAIIGKFWLLGLGIGRKLACTAVIIALAGFAAVEFFETGYIVAVLGPLAGLLVFGTTAYERIAPVPRMAPLTYLGDASYSIYLWHTFAISVVAKASAIFSFPWFLAFPGAVIGGVIGGAVAYEMVERPLVRAIRNQRTRYRERVAA